MAEAINTTILDEVTRRIIDEVHPEKIILFGSHAWGQPNEESDIDLFVILGSSDQPGYRRASRLYRSLRGLKVPVEIVVRTRDEVERNMAVKSSLDHKVLHEGRVLHG